MDKLLKKINKTNNKIGILCSAIFSGGTPNTTNLSYWNGNIPWLSSGETRNDYINQTEKTITDDGVKNSSTRLAKKGDIVIATAGQGLTRGQISFLNIDTYINQSLISLRADNKNLDSKYLFYNLKSRYSELRSLSDATSSRGSITCPMLYNLDINIPDLPTQKRIASILGAYDEKIENNNKIIKNLEETAQTIFNEWFVNFKFPGYEKVKMIESEMGEIPEKWDVSIIEDSKIFFRSKNRIGNFEGDKMYFDTSCIEKIDIIGDPIVVNKNNIPSRAQFIPEYNSIWFARMSNTYKILFFNDSSNFEVNNYILSSGMLGLKTEKKYFGFLFSLINSNEFLNKKDAMASGSTQVSLTDDGFNNIKFLIPTNDLIEKYSSLINKHVNMIIKLQKENISLKSQRDLLLNKLI
jgi:type I restriction enzyme S subunit